MQPITTMQELAEATGYTRETLRSRARSYPIKSQPVAIIRSEKIYAIGALDEWHAKTEALVGIKQHSISGFIKAGASSKRKGSPLQSNPYCYNTEIREYCAWAAGWHDAK